MAFISCFVTLMLNCLFTDIAAQTWSGRTTLDPVGKVTLTWLGEADMVTFEIKAPTTGYVAMGFSPDGRMVDSDMVVGWVVHGNAILNDRFSQDYKTPQIDGIQDYTLLSGSETGNTTTLKFKRKLVTGDVKDIDIKPGPMNIIYAFHDGDPTDGKTIEYHGLNRGHKSVTLIRT